ncbi:MAG: hypothetical protein FJ147_12165 [Deltaproteobacteria bacterium]|nr:hypothetical protein [Deltaproteobacteria bacterium]
MRKWKRFQHALRHAFALQPIGQPFASDEIALLEKVAGAIVKRGMATPALVFLESLGPLHFLGSQVMHGLKPFLDLACNPTELERLAVILERRDSLERLSSCIQEQANIPA